MKEKKTHYRKVFKSDHLGSADLEEMIEEGKPLIFTISHVNQEYSTKVAGRKIDANIAYFKEKVKPLVLNATNSKIVKQLAGGSPWVEDWAGLQIELYIDPSIKLAGEVVGGVRVKDQPPKVFTEKEIKIIQARIAACTSIDQLIELYNSNIKIKTCKPLAESLRAKKMELQEKGK